MNYVSPTPENLSHKLHSPIVSHLNTQYYIHEALEVSAPAALAVYTGGRSQEESSPNRTHNYKILG